MVDEAVVAVLVDALSACVCAVTLIAPAVAKIKVMLSAVHGFELRDIVRLAPKLSKDFRFLLCGLV